MNTDKIGFVDTLVTLPEICTWWGPDRPRACMKVHHPHHAAAAAAAAAHHHQQQQAAAAAAHAAAAAAHAAHHHIGHYPPPAAVAPPPAPPSSHVAPPPPSSSSSSSAVAAQHLMDMYTAGMSPATAINTMDWKNTSQVGFSSSEISGFRQRMRSFLRDLPCHIAIQAFHVTCATVLRTISRRSIAACN